MADLLLLTGQSVPPGTRFTYKDMGDGTFALVVAASIESAESSIDANIQVGNVDVSNANPVPISVIGIATVAGAVDANIQVGDVDVSVGNPVPIVQTGTVTILGNVTVVAPVDEPSGSLQSVTFAHHKVHGGDHFIYANAQDLTNGQTISFTLVTPATTMWSHFGFELDGESEYDLQIYEGATPQSVGTPVANPAVINNNRNSATANTLVINSSPTLGGGAKGSLIYRIHRGSGRGTGGESGTGQELILKQDEMYWIDLTNATANNNFISWVVSWYEHTNLA